MINDVLCCLCWQVFGTNVMVTVAKSFEAPIKCEYSCNVLRVQVLLLPKKKKSPKTKGFVILSSMPNLFG